MTQNKYVKEEQMAYANLLDIGMKIILAAFIITFIIYLSGLLPNQIPINELPNLWKLRVHEFIEKTGLPTGWGWFKNINKGDYLNYIPIAFLGVLTILCYIRILPIFIKKKDTIYTVLTLLEILVLVLAAIGIFKVGH
ncbi:MAG: hypothetical protein C0169_04895 [Thermodesulfobacterium geofontis]|uniref:DUF1634 domain-containing protein n=1 Tax=Thermodesulfobacterium geofontis TaxID=1295609 RepID=A0A2N7QBX7_9BACT|nr:MAG: hypothetical protein C0169_04895 [Thermodesulfobacterium geofontis]